jgi:hypothetical protein
VLLSAWRARTFQAADVVVKIIINDMTDSNVLCVGFGLLCTPSESSHTSHCTVCLLVCSGDVPVEYCGEEQAICAVGLVTPRQGVFLEAIQHLLVLCTTTEVSTALHCWNLNVTQLQFRSLAVVCMLLGV